MAKRYAVVLSDIHIGNNHPTCWYQKSVHEQPLSTALTWVAQQKDKVREVLFLGDMFDTWTYPPSVRPPTMSEIIAANPNLLGPGGPLAALVKALPGQVRFMLGNHDISLTRADIDTLNHSLLGGTAQGQGIIFDPRTWRALWGAKARTVFAHGHQWCMFNAPDSVSRWDGLPVGHFVTRIIGYNVAKRLAASGVPTAAHLPGHGNPDGISAAGIISSWNARDDLAGFLLSYLCHTLGMSPSEPILMPGGRTSSCVEAMKIYSGLFTRWVKKENGHIPNALRAAKADKGSGDDLAWFAQRLALQTGSDLVIMGHTHKPVSGLKVAPCNYVNSGFECVPVPDKDDRFTLTVVDLETAVAKLFTVTGSGVVPINVPRMDSAILSPFQDYSCYVGIQNGPRPLRLVKTSKDSDSYWVIPPPQRIDANEQRVAIWLSDTLGPHGSEGSFTYTDGTRTLDFSFSCPFRVSSNKVSSPVPVFETKVGDAHDWRIRDVEGSGHPLQVRFHVESLPASTGATAAPPGGQVPAGVPGGGQHELPEYGFPEFAGASAGPRWVGAAGWHR
ncbi:MAG: metallophosphoesterase [Solirubrobacteraceae bacterium]